MMGLVGEPFFFSLFFDIIQSYLIGTWATPEKDLESG